MQHIHSSVSLPPASRVLRKVLGWALLLALGGTVATSLAVRAIAQTAPLTAAATNSTPVSSAATVSAEAMAHTCAACHGTFGRLGDESFMPLAGMPVKQFVTTMADFREVRRPSTLMGHVAQGFSDAEIRAMAEFFAKVEPAPKGVQ